MRPFIRYSSTDSNTTDACRRTLCGKQKQRFCSAFVLDRINSNYIQSSVAGFASSSKLCILVILPVGGSFVCCNFYQPLMFSQNGSSKMYEVRVQYLVHRHAHNDTAIFPTERALHPAAQIFWAVNMLRPNKQRQSTATLTQNRNYLME